MTKDSLQKEIEEAVPKLLHLARELTWNYISDNCEFILTEIKNGQENFHVERQLINGENDKKIPLPFQEIIRTLENLYDNLFDINLYIYEAKKNATIIDIRYYLKSSLDKDYMQKVITNHPMLHCKVSMPRWLSDNKEKFDINWERS